MPILFRTDFPNTSERDLLSALTPRHERKQTLLCYISTSLNTIYKMIELFVLKTQPKSNNTTYNSLSFYWFGPIDQSIGHRLVFSAQNGTNCRLFESICIGINLYTAKFRMNNSSIFCTFTSAMKPPNWKVIRNKMFQFQESRPEKLCQNKCFIIRVKTYPVLFMVFIQ